MKLDKLSRCERKLRYAAYKMASEINAHFPVGCPVKMTWGRGEMLGVVASPAWDSPDTCREVSVKSQNGRVYRRYYSEVRRIM